MDILSFHCQGDVEQMTRIYKASVLGQNDTEENIAKMAAKSNEKLSMTNGTQNGVSARIKQNKGDINAR